MVTTRGNASRAITGGGGIDIPLQPPALSAQQMQARQHRQTQAIEAAETARPTQHAPLPHRRVAAPVPAPAQPHASRPAQKLEADASKAGSLASATSLPDPGVGESSLVRQLRAELAMAGTRITHLRAQVEEQDTYIAQAVHDVLIATELVQHIRDAAAEQHAFLDGRATFAEQARAIANQQIAALQRQLAVARHESAARADQHEPVSAGRPGATADAARATGGERVVCAGGCGLAVDAQYIARTGTTWHGSCADRVPADIRLAARRAAA